MLLARTGLRSGELLALRWGDIDFNKSEMRVDRALHYDETLPVGERYVIGTVKGGRPRTITFDRTCATLLQEWRKKLPAILSGAEGLPRLTVHEPRHTHASLLFEAGQSVKVVQERLGHASAQVTLNTYAHLLHEAQTRAAAALNELLASGGQADLKVDRDPR